MRTRGSHKFIFFSLLAVACSLLVSSCLPDPLEVKGIKSIKPQIVVSSQIIPDQTLLVMLTKSFGALDASDDSDPQQVLRQIAVDDALVTITGPTQTDTLASIGYGLYGGVFIPFEPGAEYTLNVNSASLGTVTATTTVKPGVTFDDVNAYLYFDGFDDTLAQVDYMFKDLPEKNYYMINATEVEWDEFQEDLLNPSGYSRLLDDIDFTDEYYAESFLVFRREFEKGDTIAVYLSNIDKAYYDFVKLRLDNRFSFVEYLSEPINYPTNVEGGKGFFNLYIPDIEFIVLE